MKQRIKKFLKRYPAIYALVKMIYYTLGSSILGRFLTWHERQWETRALSAAEGYWNNRNNPNKHLLVERIAALSPIHSILEVGCNSGPNLYLLAKKFPQAQIVGIDINSKAVQYGNAQFAQEGIPNVQLLVGKADELGQFQDKSFDVVFTRAVLIHIGPDKIKNIVEEMIRVSRRALILMEGQCFEPQDEDPNGMGIYCSGIWKAWRMWRRDYVALLKQYVPAEQIRVIRIPEEVWTVEESWEPWSVAVIEVLM